VAAGRRSTAAGDETESGAKKRGREACPGEEEKDPGSGESTGITFEEAERWLDERDAGVANSAARHQARMEKAAENFKGDEFD
jgi:hypothetical protein